jgi:predicted enzyme related to lactoylglutathione lyase
MKILRLSALAASLALLTIFFSTGTALADNSESMKETITFFYYKDLDAQLPFYEDLLKLEKTMDAEWVKIYRITPTSSVGLVLEGRGVHEASDNKPAMLSIVTDDVDSWYEKMLDAKVKVTHPLKPAGTEKEEGSAPVRGFIVEDPGGYTIEFFRWINKD